MKLKPSAEKRQEKKKTFKFNLWKFINKKSNKKTRILY